VRILLIHQAFCGPNDPGGTRHYELGRRLVALGHRFTVITSRYNYLTGKDRAPFNAIPGFELRVAPALSGIHRSYGRRALGFGIFALTSIAKGLAAGPLDVVLGTSPPLFQALSAFVVARLRRCRFVLEIRDLWPEFALELGVLRNRGFIWLAKQLERFLYHAADGIIVNSPGYIPHLTKHGVPESKISIVPNGVDTTCFHPEDTGRDFRRQHGFHSKLVVMYAGALGLANDVDSLVLVANRLRSYPDIVFAIVGEGKELPRVERECRSKQLTNVHLIPAQPKQRMPQVLAAADICVAVLKGIPMFRTTYPNKVFDYMAAGRPTVLAIDGVIRKVIEEADGGIFVTPGDDAALADAILRLRDASDLRQQMGMNARRYVTEHFERDKQAAAFADALECR
jgi:glycosyltransferase involved in cell wall biosynthesis